MDKIEYITNGCVDVFDQVSRSGIRPGLTAGMAFAPAAMTGLARQSINLSDKAAAANPTGTQAAVDVHSRQLNGIDRAIRSVQSQAAGPQAGKAEAPTSVGRQIAGAAIGAMAFSVGGPLGAMMAMGDAIKIGGAMMGAQHDTRSAPKPEFLATRHVSRERGRTVENFTSISLNPNKDSGYSAAPAAPVNAGDISTTRSSLKGIIGVKPSAESQRTLRMLTQRRREEIETLSIADRLGFDIKVEAPSSRLAIQAPTMGTRRGLGGLAMGMAA